MKHADFRLPTCRAEAKRRRLADFRFFGLVVMVSGLLLARPAAAADSLYENDAVVTDPAPIPDATNFLNTGTYIVTTPFNQPYKTHDTLNYTNTGYMEAYYGFQFDTYSTATSLDSEAASFDNESSYDFFGDYGIYCGTKFIVWATNIVNPGSVDVGGSGLIQYTGQYVDLSHSDLTLEQQSGIVNFNSSGAIGIDTNADWDPSVDLQPTYADSSWSGGAKYPAGNFLDLFNSAPYFDVRTNGFDTNGANDVIYRAVFVENNSPNAPYNVYIDDPNTTTIGFEPGAAHVEWVGTYVDPATGNPATNYLYLTDNYALGASTNVSLVNGMPGNFQFIQSATPLLSNPVSAGFDPVFPSGAITNRYAYMNAQLISTTVPTNASLTNPSGALTNLPGRVQITANGELNLNIAEISGMNYLSLAATNQFDGSGGALIPSPYTDINLGVTNGFLTVSNLLEAAIPVWSGPVQAWSTRWLAFATNFVITFDTNNVATTNFFTVTNDFRVFLVNSQFSPVSAPTVQNLKLHSTNSVVISDVMNVIGSLYIDGQNLTLTTNGIGNGATSLDGELNLNNSGIFWPSSLPNLRWLTNNGAIRLGNLAYFGSTVPTLATNITPGTPADAAAGTLSQLGVANVTNNDKVTIGSWQYAFTNHIAVNTLSNRVLIASTFDGSMSNLIAAINGASGSGTKYSSATKKNTQVTAGSLAGHAFAVTAIVAGTAGNSIATTTTSTHLTWNGHATLFGGVNAIPPTTNVVVVWSGHYGAFINSGLVSDQGSIIYADNFLNSGEFYNGLGNFTLGSVTTTLTNGFIFANGGISITADTLMASGAIMEAGGSLTLQATNLLTDVNVMNGNFWYVGGGALSGLNLPIKPAAGDLLGTTIYMMPPPPNKQVKNIWAGQDFGISTSGYTNNEAIGQLILDALANNSSFYFTGTGASNAMYVDSLQLLDYASYTNHDAGGNIPTLFFNTNLVIYYADATAGGVDVSDKLNHKNGDHLRWVASYAGYFSSTNLVYPDGSTNTFNIGLVKSTTLDSDGDGIPNDVDSTPLFTSGEVNFMMTLTNIPPLTVRLMWDSIPAATNSVLYQTNIGGNSFVLTNFVSPALVPPAGGWPITNIVYDPIHPMPRFYHVLVSPDNATLYGQ